ncbi:MAG: hypothetical protein M1546_14790 [Chloroflexi bacterium]|nr:hypothetical protein [Chloroflexota bacterium]
MAHVQLSLHDLSRLVVLQTQGGKSRDEIVRVLVARGWPEISAVRFVNTTLTEEAVRAAHAQVPEEDEQPAHQAFSVDQESWRVLLIIVLITMVLIACMLSAYAR